MGHRSLESTQIYLHVTGKELEESINQLQQISFDIILNALPYATMVRTNLLSSNEDVFKSEFLLESYFSLSIISFILSSSHFLLPRPPKAKTLTAWPIIKAPQIKVTQ